MSVYLVLNRRTLETNSKQNFLKLKEDIGKCKLQKYNNKRCFN